MSCENKAWNFSYVNHSHKMSFGLLLLLKDLIYTEKCCLLFSDIFFFKDND